MKVIELKVLGNNPVDLKKQFDAKEITNEQFNELAKSIYLNYRDTIKTVLDEPSSYGQQTMSVTDMRKSLKIGDKIDALKDGDKLYLEDADHEFIKGRVSAMNFRIAHKHIVQFVDDVVDAPQAEMPKA